MKKTLIVGNWKMHLNTLEASLLLHRLHQNIPIHREIEVVLAPSLLSLQPLSLQIDHRKFRLATQNAFAKDEGAFTGEVSFTMLRNLVQYALIGHSERRIYFNESLEMIRDKVAAAIRNQIVPILCVGETKPERAAGETKQVIHDQLTTALSNLTSQEIEKVVVAYEPVWAISTFDGDLAKPDDITRVIQFIRLQIRELYGSDTAEGVRVLYGGSIDADLAPGYLAIPGCDGCLVGAASINYQQFAAIVDAAYRLKHEVKKDHE
ncbi:MAG TPA: triose-phosphate isomerase [Candidatus Dormibacteraeota bacterium]|nr:triose-phosphate isomerase [Candidatus Dormibacteraeota bacterium]